MSFLPLAILLIAQANGQNLDLTDRWSDKSGKLAITVSEPFIISSRIARPEMGTHEQPHLFKMPTGDVLLVFHEDRDIHGAKRVILRSRDKGKTWSVEPECVNRDEAIGSLRDGTVLIYDCYSFLKGDNVYAKDMFISRDKGETFQGPTMAMIHIPQLGKTLSSPVSDRIKKIAARYKETSAQWSDANGPNFWRTILDIDDGTLLACGHTKFKGDPRCCRIVCYVSTDKGMNWRVLATVAQDDKVGFYEPVMSLCSNGDVLCVIRRGGNKPLMQARSTDGGKTWAEFKETGSLGVDPDMCLMSNGVLACSYGRPGNRIMFSADGTGKQWTDRVQIYEYKSGSFGYTGIVEVEPGKLLYVYDRRDVFPEYDEKQTTAIQGVYITVRKKN